MSQVELSELNEGEGPECLTLPLGEASNAPKCSWMLNNIQVGKARTPQHLAWVTKTEQEIVGLETSGTFLYSVISLRISNSLNCLINVQTV